MTFMLARPADRPPAGYRYVTTCATRDEAEATAHASDGGWIRPPFNPGEGWDVYRSTRR